ncbi:MobA/MobL family protein [Xanthomonas hortorum pv. pelargonii]|uniref:MobQ family relaxase n=1 Tax=Xanthomonas hortorum TaxID=56454 RepID=UPI0021C7578E|nr:MobQ family relaxase [Xanthomonas hortorum]MCU1706794.1 MobA/MobL family protein [Xanthomonas hortorum pv. pelargonii]MCU1715357.1 MobA/MobL family protein [Xanthomonas hortorum pv. pelargonii]UXN02148.1 MobA/MobL family protein [Xanthomonas hortorum pv. pelargonii]
MAIFHLCAKVIGRSAGRSATAAAAYRSGTEVVDMRTGEVHDYSRRGGVRETFILAPVGSSEWVSDRSALWNAVEAAEKRKDAQLCREVEVSLPHELSHNERRRLLVEFCEAEFVALGMVADVAMHSPGHEGDKRNEHAHIMLTMRRVEGQGFGQKAREWNSKDLVEQWRSGWAERVNARLAEHAIQATVDHRSYVRQALAAGHEVESAAVPTVHLGPKASAMERRGEQTELGDQNRKVIAFNAQRKVLRRELSQVSAQIIDLEKARSDRAARSVVPPRSGVQVRAPRRVGESREAREMREAAERVTEVLMALLGLGEPPTSHQVRAEIFRRRPAPVTICPSGAVLETQALLQVIESKLAKVENRNRALNEDVAKYRDFVAQDERVAAWREAHPYRARMHDLGVARTEEAEFCGHDLEEAKGRIAELQKELRDEYASLGKAKEEQAAYLAQLQGQAAAQALTSGAPATVELIEQLEQHAAVLEAYERSIAEAAARLPETADDGENLDDQLDMDRPRPQIN